jgi:O-antigen/teichoic acid export membrane protein
MKKKQFIWNMLGSGIYSLATVIFVMLAKRLVGEEAGAKFYMAFTTGQMLLTIGYFEIRPFHVTDVKQQYKAKEYFGFRVISSAAMLACAVVVGIVYVVNGKADAAGFMLIITMCILKMFDGIADVFEGEFQRNDRIDISGMSMAFRTMAIMAAFSIIAWVTRNIYAASAAAAVTGLAGTAVVAVVWSRWFEPLSVSFDREKMKSLFRSTILLFIGSAMCMWLWNGTKYVVEWTLTDRDTLAYGIVFMPTMVINLGSSFVFKPMLTTLARHYEQGEYKAFAKLVAILVATAVGITVVTLGAGAWLGIPVLSWLYDIELAPYKSVMLVLIAAGGFNAVSILFYYALTVMRLQKEIFAGYTITFVVSIILPIVMVKAMGIAGAGTSYLIVMMLLTVLFGGMLCVKLKKRK